MWKIKQRYDMFRRRQRLYVEMEQMASRPFSQVSVSQKFPLDLKMYFSLNPFFITGSCRHRKQRVARDNSRGRNNNQCSQEAKESEYHENLFQNPL